MNYARGEADLYYVTYALEDVRGGRVTRRAKRFVSFAEQLRSWLSTEFSSKRGKHAIDNPQEYERVLGDA